MVHKPARSWGLILLVALAGCGAADNKPELQWVRGPSIVKQPELPRDRIAVGAVKNGSKHELRLDATKARVLDSAGRELQSTVRFAAAYGHGLYSYDQAPKEGEPEFERRRLGELAVIEAGKTAPLTVSWRLVDGRGAAARLVIGKTVIRLPESR